MLDCISILIKPFANLIFWNKRCLNSYCNSPDSSFFKSTVDQLSHVTICVLIPICYTLFKTKKTLLFDGALLYKL